MNRNAGVEAWRFIGALSIAIYHFWIVYLENNRFRLLYIWVEFFFIVSGYFLGKNRGRGESFAYVWRQIKKLWPTYLVAFLGCFIYRHLLDGVSVNNWMMDLFKAKDEILMTQAICLQEHGNYAYNFGGPAAYISVQLLATLLLHFILSIDKERKWTPYVLFFVVLLGYAYILNTYGNLSIWIVYDKFFCVGVLRGICGMSVGVIFSMIPTWNKKYSIVIQLGAIICLTVLFCGGSVLGFADMLFFLPVFGVAVKSATEIEFALPNWMKNLFLFLGKLSTPIFLFHSAVILGMQYHLRSVWTRRDAIILFFIIILLVSVIVIAMQRVFGMVTKRLLIMNRLGE